MSRQKRAKNLSSDVLMYVRFGTPTEVAEWRAERLAALKPRTIIEVGAGAGFQTTAFSKAAERVIAVDVDEERLSYGTFSENVIVLSGDALDRKVVKQIGEQLLPPCIVFLDPERPSSSKERSLDEIEPNIKEFVETYSEFSQDIAIELPPFLNPSEIPFSCEREYLSLNGTLNRLTVYLGGLKRCEVSVVALPEKKILEIEAREAKKERERPRTSAGTAPRFILEPNPALVRAGVVAAALRRAGVEETRLLNIGNKEVILAEKSVKSPFFRSYAIIANKRTALRQFGRVILHGRISQEEQGALLKTLSKECQGEGECHLFLGKEQYLTTLVNIEW